MLVFMFHPRTTRMTTAMAYMLMPLISTVMKANEMEEMAWLPGPKRSFRYPGTECVLQM